MADEKDSALEFKILGKCSCSKARTSVISLPHYDVQAPVFMPVGTQGTLKGMTPFQLEELDCHIILGNTYHLGMRPGPDLLDKVGGLHNFMNWKRAILTDSGGFQMVSLVKLSEVSEEGVKFQSPHDSTEMLLTPEKSMEIQNAIGADVMMQLDDVISSLTTGPRVEEAMYRSIRWLDRCIKAHKRPCEQNLFPIIQGGLDPKLRKICCKEMTERDCPGYAIGGLSGGEEKEQFWKIVSLCTDLLPEDKPRYCMGIGYTIDLIVCVALGVDMFDCVYPTRTARFGTALTATGQLSLKNQKYAKDFSPLEKDCLCSTCQRHSRAYVHSLFNREPVGCHLITVHNIYYQMKLMKDMRKSIQDDKFPEFVKKRFKMLYPNSDFPSWAVNALASVGILLDENHK